jgi:hypothetical protein
VEHKEINHYANIINSRRAAAHSRAQCAHCFPVSRRVLSDGERRDRGTKTVLTDILFLLLPWAVVTMLLYTLCRRLNGV